MVVRFRVGKHDNPKVNALLLVEGGIDDTHFKNLHEMKKELMSIAEEKVKEKERAEQLFNEDTYDFDERIDGQGMWNQLLSKDYLFEGAMISFIFIFFRVIPK